MQPLPLQKLQPFMIVGRATRAHSTCWILATIVAACVLSGTAHAEGKRHALLIGNQAYDASVGVLKNPHNDIELVAEALRKQRFEILPSVKDAKRAAILGAVRELVARLNSAGAGAIGFLYYSGHGAAEKDTNINYIIPVDAKNPGSTLFWDESLKIDDVIRLLEGARSAVKFIVFDACRNELQMPIRGASKGLLPVAEQRGFFVAYSAAPGQTALDGSGSSSPYAAALTKELVRPGLDHLNLFQNVKEDVISITSGSQHPWESNGLTRRVYLAGEPSIPADMALWDSVRSTNDSAALQRYLDRFPFGVFAATAQQMLERLKTEEAQREAARQFEIERRAQEAKVIAELQKALESARKDGASISPGPQTQLRPQGREQETVPNWLRGVWQGSVVGLNDPNLGDRRTLKVVEIRSDGTGFGVWAHRRDGSGAPNAQMKVSGDTLTIVTIYKSVVLLRRTQAGDKLSGTFRTTSGRQFEVTLTRLRT